MVYRRRLRLELVLKILLLVACVVMIASVLLQQGNSAGLSGSIGGGAEQLFGKKKSRGYESLLTKATLGGAIIFIVCSIIIVAMENSAA
jgi:preprotein translocase subunit SecG